LTPGVVSHRSSSDGRNLTMFAMRILLSGFSVYRETL
jgi:hypothetical protein